MKYDIYYTKSNSDDNQQSNTMATTPQMYDEIARILRVTRNNVEYEAERNKSQLLCDVAATLGNLATLVDNIITDMRALELSHKKENERKIENESSTFMTYLKYKDRRGKSCTELFHVEH